MDENSNDFLHKMKRLDVCFRRLETAMEETLSAITDFYKGYIEPTVKIPTRTDRVE
jgi:hypothetical protein